MNDQHTYTTNTNTTENLTTTGNLTKRELVLRISEDTKLIQQQVCDVIQLTLDYIIKALANGRDVELRNFGVFELRLTKARIGRNPNKPETDVPIPERATVKFKCGKTMKKKIEGLTGLLRERKEKKSA